MTSIELYTALTDKWIPLLKQNKKSRAMPSYVVALVTGSNNQY